MHAHTHTHTHTHAHPWRLDHPCRASGYHANRPRPRRQLDGRGEVSRGWSRDGVDGPTYHGHGDERGAHHRHSLGELHTEQVPGYTTYILECTCVTTRSIYLYVMSEYYIMQPVGALIRKQAHQAGGRGHRGYWDPLQAGQFLPLLHLAELIVHCTLEVKGHQWRSKVTSPSGHMHTQYYMYTRAATDAHKTSSVTHVHLRRTKP